MYAHFSSRIYMPIIFPFNCSSTISTYGARDTDNDTSKLEYYILSSGGSMHLRNNLGQPNRTLTIGEFMQKNLAW